VIVVHEIQVLYSPATYYNNFMIDSFRNSGICMFLCSFVIWCSYSVQAVENAKQVRDETVDVNVLFSVCSSWEGHKTCSINHVCVAMCKEAEADIKTRTENVAVT